MQPIQVFCSFAPQDKIAVDRLEDNSGKPRFFVEAHFANLFSREAEERAEELAQQVSREEPIPSEHQERPALSSVLTSLSSDPCSKAC